MLRGRMGGSLSEYCFPCASTPCHPWSVPLGLLQSPARCGPSPHTSPTERARKPDCVRYYGPSGGGGRAIGSAEPGSFGELLRRNRTAAGLTQEELAHRAGLSARGVQDLERGLRRSPHPETTRRLAEALGLGDAERGELLGAVDRAGSPGDSESGASSNGSPADAANQLRRSGSRIDRDPAPAGQHSAAHPHGRRRRGQDPPGA
jgi:transcriptional regulator with XRE-family HTH domain